MESENPMDGLADVENTFNYMTGLQSTIDHELAALAETLQLVNNYTDEARRYLGEAVALINDIVPSDSVDTEEYYNTSTADTPRTDVLRERIRNLEARLGEGGRKCAAIQAKLVEKIQNLEARRLTIQARIDILEESRTYVIESSNALQRVLALDRTTQSRVLQRPGLRTMLRNMYRVRLVLAASETTIAALNTRNLIQEDAEDGESWSCIICGEERGVGSVVTQLECGHEFDRLCLEHWLRNYRANCPLCRADVRPNPQNSARVENEEASAATPQEESIVGAADEDSDEGATTNTVHQR